MSDEMFGDLETRPINLLPIMICQFSNYFLPQKWSTYL